MVEIKPADIRIKRVYEESAREDGRRILVDRLWPRGMSRAKVAIDDWMKEIAPSSALRKWFGHDPERWTEFRRRYLAELHKNGEQLDVLRALARDGPITLVYAARDERHNDAAVLRDCLLKPDK